MVLLGTLLDRLIEFQWDLDFCQLAVVTIARFAELEVEGASSRRRKKNDTAPADVLVRGEFPGVLGVVVVVVVVVVSLFNVEC